MAPSKIKSLEALAEEILKEPGVSPDCWLSSTLGSLHGCRAELERVKERNYPPAEVSLAEKHVAQFDRLLDVYVLESQKDLLFFKENEAEIATAIKNGKTRTITDWGHGWEWEARVVEVNGELIQIHKKGLSLYRGQNGKPFYQLNALQSN